MLNFSHYDLQKMFDKYQQRRGLNAHCMWSFQCRILCFRVLTFPTSLQVSKDIGEDDFLPTLFLRLHFLSSVIAMPFSALMDLRIKWNNTFVYSIYT